MASKNEIPVYGNGIMHFCHFMLGTIFLAHAPNGSEREHNKYSIISLEKTLRLQEFYSSRIVGNSP